MAFATFTWEIADKKYLSFVNGKPQQEFTSSLFEVDGIKFYLKCYPNGRKKSGLVNLYLTLSQPHFPSNIAKLKINYWLFCPQTHSRMSDIRDFSNDDNNAFHGWATNTLNIKELENNTVHNITFEAGVNILKIYFKNEVAKGSDINTSNKVKQPLIYEKPFKMLPKITFNWNINEFMFKSFLSAPNKKCWESQQFGQWVLGCYPNGHTKNDKGNAMLYLKCLGLPPAIYGVRIRYTLYCPQTSLKWSYIQNYNYANTNYANATFKTDTLHSLKSLSFEITINILKLFDLNRKEVGIKVLKNFLKMPSPSLTTLPNNNDENKQQKTQRPTHDDNEEGDKGTLLPFDIYGTIQGIRDKLIGISNREPNECILSVQEQVDIYSKELQAMNREIHSIRKGFKVLQSKQNKSNDAFQTVLKQVKIIKDEITLLKNKQNEDEKWRENEDKMGVDDDNDENKVNNADIDDLERVNVRLNEVKNEMEMIKNDIKGINNIGCDDKIYKDIDDLKQEVDSLKDDILVEEITNLKEEINVLKGLRMDEENKKNNEMNALKEENKEMKERMSDLEDDIKKLNEMMMRQQSIFEQSSLSMNTINDDNKNDDGDDEDKERMKQMKEWVFSKLDFNKNDLNSIYNKLINDGFDDISLLSELNDDTLKSMGIHKRGDRIKILRACKTINDHQT